MKMNYLWWVFLTAIDCSQAELDCFMEKIKDILLYFVLPVCFGLLCGLIFLVITRRCIFGTLA